MSTLNRSLRLSAVALVLFASASSAGSDLNDTWRGWYLWGQGPSPMIVLNFNLDASFWVRFFMDFRVKSRVAFYANRELNMNHL
jgi:hypothetical protein